MFTYIFDKLYPLKSQEDIIKLYLIVILKTITYYIIHI